MSTKELLLSKIDTMSQAELEELYTVVTEFLQSKRNKPSASPFLERLSQIHIDGPEDFAENIDLYLNGEKQIAPAVH
ncbi:MAG: hypothetical protein KJ069_21145 [Anaerolineae bacterium]|nr:hypothetical protein [Anaerolineae bacterium]